MIELKYLVGAVETPFYNIKLKDFTHSSEFMAEAVISAEIALLEDIADDEWKTSFLSYQGETWRCFTPPAKKKGSTQLEYIYTLTYKPESEILKGIKFLDRVSVLPKLTTGLSVVVYSGGISEFADRLSANLARIGGWNVYVEAGLDDTPKDITIDNQYVWDALATIPDEYKYKYTIKGKKIYIWNTVGYVFPDTFKVGDTISHEFQYGKDNGLYEINKSVTEDKVLGYVRGSGSERNIPLNYYRDSERFAANPCPDYAPALMPKIYTQGDPTAIPPIAPWAVDYYKNDAEIAKGNITEEFVRFDGTDGNEEIYPTIKGVTYNNLPIDELLMVGDIGSDEISDTGKVIDDEFDVTLNPLGFNLSKCISAKGEMIMNMQSGMCSGANFKIVGINGKRTNGVNNAKNYYFFPKLVLDDTYWWGNHSEDVVLGFYGQGQGEQTLAYTKEMKWGEGSILRNDSVQIGDGVNVTLTPLMRDRYSDAEIILQGGGSWPLLYGSSVNLEGLVAIAEQEVKDANLGYLPAGMWDLVMRISYNTVGTEDIIGGGYLYLPFDKDVPFMTDKGTIVFPDNIQDTSITLTLQKSLGDYDILIPNATLYPQAGDKFVLINADLPDFLVIAAEERLENALKAYRDSHAYNKFNYDINIDSKFINDNPSIASLLKVGNRLKIGSEALNILNVSTEYKRDSIFPNYTVRVSPTTQRVVSTKRATAEKADKVATDTSMILKALVATNRDTINRTVALEVRASGINAGAEPQDRVEIYPNYSNGANQIPSIVDNGNGTVTLGAGQYNLSSNASGAGLISLYTITGGTFNLVNDAQNYIVANYNNGTPIVEVISNVELINETTIIPIYSIYRNGNFLHITNWDALGLALSNKIHQSIVKTQRYRRESGLSLSENGSRNLTLSTGRIWTGAVPITLAEINTAVDNIRFWYKVGGVWTFSLTPTYNNTHYCNGTDLVELTSNRYAINWVFRGVESQKHLYIVVGSGDYTLAQAQGATVPALPVGISSHATLVGKIIVQKGANTATSIQSAFDAQFSYSSPTAHNDMTGIQGGVAGDHQHFTTQEKTIATQSANATRNGYLTSSDWSKFDTAYNDRLKWDGGASSLNAANGRASLGLGTAALKNTSDFLGATAQAVDSAKLGGQLPSYYQVNIAAGLSTDYYTGNKTWTDFSTAVRATSLLGYAVGGNSPLLVTDTIMQAFGKVQGQINARALSTDLTAHTGNGNIHLTNDEKAYLIKLYTYLKFASDNSSLYSTINFYSESGVSAYGIGTGGGGGAGVDIIDDLLSVRADAALSANQGRILKGFVDLKQPQLNGLGFVKANGTSISYDNNSYALASHNHNTVYHPLMSTIFSLGGSYVAVRTANRTASQYYEFWDSGAGWAKIHSGGFINASSSDSYILLGGGGTKAISDFALASTLTSHTGNTSNPHSVTAAQVGALALAGGSVTGTLNASDFRLPLISVTTENWSEVYNQEARLYILDIYNMSSLGTESRYGTILGISGKSYHDKTQLIFNGVNGHIQYRKSWYSNTAWSAIRTLWDSSNLLNIGTTASTARTALGLGTMATETASNYLTTATAASTYLPLSGGTLSGKLTLNQSGKKLWEFEYPDEYLYAYDSVNARAVRYYENASNELRFYSIDENGVTRGIGLKVFDGSNYNAVIHSGNIGSQSVNYAASAGNADTLDTYHATSFLRKNETYAMDKYVLESIPKNTTQVGYFGWVDYQTTPYAGGGFLTLNMGSSLRSLLMIFPDYSNNDNIKVLTSIDGAAWGQQKEIAWKDHNHDDRYYTETEIGNYFSGAVGITGYNKSNWDTAYSYSQIGHLPLSGGTLRGNTSAPLILDSPTTATTLLIKLNGITQGYLAYNSSNGIFIGHSYAPPTALIGILYDGSKTPYFSPNNGTTKYGLLHAGNYSSYALPLYGGTLSGGLTLSEGRDLSLKAPTGSSDSGDLVFLDGNGIELHRLWSGSGTLSYRANGGTSYGLYHSGNSNSSSVAWAASTFTEGGTLLSNKYTRTNGVANVLYTPSSLTVNLNTVDGLAGIVYTEGQNCTNTPTSYGSFLQFADEGGNDVRTQFWNSYDGAEVYTRIMWGNTNWKPWRKLWHDGNLTNTLSNGYLPYWNGSSLGDTILWFGSSNVYIGSKRADDAIGLISQNYSMGYTYSTKFITLQSATEQYGITNDYGVGTGAQLSIVANQTFGNIGFYTGGAKGDKNERMRILSNGNVGIGYTDRSEKFAVAGGGYFNSTLTAPTFNTGGSRPVTITSGGISIKADAGGWAMQYSFVGSSGTNRGGFGAYGGGDGVEYFFVGHYNSASAKFYPSGSVAITTSLTAPTITATTELKIGAGWSAIQNGSNELELRYGGVMKAKLSSSGDILAVGGVTAFAV